jgi:hypothetical protein
MFEEAVNGNPELADHLAWLLYRVVREMAEGKKGRERVVNTMKLGVEWVYGFTEARNVSFKAFLYHPEGVVVPSDMPEEVLKGVIERAEQKHKDIDGDKPDSTQPNKAKLRRKGKRKR